jgi:hypothetical protein
VYEARVMEVTVSQTTTFGESIIESDRSRPAGRHALNEDALFTPIFHALTRHDRPEPPPARPVPLAQIIAFQRDPLAAPIPVQALVPKRPLPRCIADVEAQLARMSAPSAAASVPRPAGPADVAGSRHAWEKIGVS